MVLLDHKDLWVLKEKLEIQVLEVLRDHQGLEVSLDCLEKTEKVDKMESLAQVVQQVPLVREDYLECLAYLAQRDIEDFQVLMELKETWESLVKKEKKVHMVRWDHQDLWDQQDPEVSEEEKVHLVRRD